MKLRQFDDESTDARAAAVVVADAAREAAAAHGIRSILTVLIFRGGREVDRIIGLLPRARYERALEAARAME